MPKQTTIRLPKGLSQRLDELASRLGFSRSDLIKTAILKYLVTDKSSDFSETTVGSGDFVRTVIYLNDNLKGYLKQLSASLGTSVNALIIYASSKTCDYYSELLTELGL